MKPKNTITAQRLKLYHHGGEFQEKIISKYLGLFLIHLSCSPVSSSQGRHRETNDNLHSPVGNLEAPVREPRWFIAQKIPIGIKPTAALPNQIFIFFPVEHSEVINHDQKKKKKR